MLGPNGMNVLQGLGLADKLLQRESGLEVSHITINDGAGQLIGRVPQGCVERHGFASTAILRWDIHEVLLDEVERKGLDMRWNSRVESVDESDSGVLIRWSEAGEKRERKADLVIGADGIWSMIRPRYFFCPICTNASDFMRSIYKCLGLEAPKPRYSGLVGIGFILPIDAVPGLSTLLTLDQPVIMVHSRLGFVGIMRYDKEGKKVGWWVDCQYIRLSSS